VAGQSAKKEQNRPWVIKGVPARGWSQPQGSENWYGNNQDKAGGGEVVNRLDRRKHTLECGSRWKEAGSEFLVKKNFKKLCGERIKKHFQKKTRKDYAFIPEYIARGLERRE